MQLQRTQAIILRQWYLMRNNWTRLVQLFVWICLDVIMWGFISRYLDSFAAAGLNAAIVLLGAAIFWNFHNRVQQGLMMAFLEDVWSRNFLNLFSSPLKIHEYILGLVITSCLTTSVGFIAMIIIGSAFFQFPLLAYGGYIFFFLLILLLFGLSLGIFAIAIILRFGQAAEWLAWPIPFILGPFVGVFYPIGILPAPMQWISKILPPSYAFEGMRALIHGNDIETWPLILGIGLAIVYLGLNFAFFVHMYKRVLRNGQVTRFGAESI